MSTENSNSTMDLECSENPIMTSTRIEDSSSMSLLKDNTLNEGFLIDSGSLSLSAVNDVSVNGGHVNISNEAQQSEDTESHLDTDNYDETTLPNTTGEEGTEEGPSEMELEGEAHAQEQDYEDTEADADLANTESNVEMELEADGDDDEEEENAPDYELPQFPISRVKKIMSICINTAEKEEEEAVNDKNSKTKEKKGKGGPMIITKEAAYLMSLAAEHFVGSVGEMAGRITVSSKKKTLNLEHLKRALSDSDTFAFLEGCFQPSIIIGD